MRTVVFLPAWNEEGNLPAVLDEIHTDLPDVDVLVVDDGSTDRTADVAHEHGAEVLSFGENRGLEVGIAAGYGYALAHEYELCGRVDADGQHPVSEMKLLLGGGPGSATSRSAPGSQATNGCLRTATRPLARADSAPRCCVAPWASR
jgi:glycosyltransferase involved in cell wall biosynthesis